jgi:hemolysin III
VTVASISEPEISASNNLQAKPRFRGWLHAGMFPLTAAAGTALMTLAQGGAAKVSSAVFVGTALMLFGTSAVYHLGDWGPGWSAALRRIDHSNIALIIAGTYTPLALLLLPRRTSVFLLCLIWGGALAAILVRVFWLNAPRWSYVPIYIALGWTAVWFMPQFWRAGPAIVWLLLAGGIAYTAGAVVYGLKKPNPWPRHFGFHEIFHAFTVAGFTSHFIAVSLAALGTP